MWGILSFNAYIFCYYILLYRYRYRYIYIYISIINSKEKEKKLYSFETLRIKPNFHQLFIFNNKKNNNKKKKKKKKVQITYTFDKLGNADRKA